MSGLDFDFKVDEDGYIVLPEGEDHGLRNEEAETTRIEDVELPTGHSTRLEVPGLACLLWAGDSKHTFVKTIWRHPAGRIDKFDIDESEYDFMYEWGLVEFAKRQRAIGLGAVCKMFGCTPSKYIGIKDRMAAFLFDERIAQTLSDEEARQMEQLEKRKKGESYQLSPDPQDELGGKEVNG